MGCDGGTIPKRDELVKTRKKPEQVLKLLLCWILKHLSDSFIENVCSIDVAKSLSFSKCRKTKMPKIIANGDCVHHRKKSCVLR